ncbi:MAG: branched-chain amino acid ABC transporter permease [Actinomycetota bacterium]
MAETLAEVVEGRAPESSASAEPALLPPPPAKRYGRMTVKQWIGLAAIVLALLPPLWMGEFGALVLQTGAIWVTAILGLHILTHWAGQISLGHVAFVALGAFMTANFAAEWNLPFWLAIFLAAMVTVGGSIVIGLPALRIRGFYIAIVTLALGLAADRWLFRLESVSGGSSGIKIPKATLPGVEFGSSRATYYIVVVTTIAMVALARTIGRSKAGRALLAIRANEEVAAAWGINVAAYKLLAFAVAAGFAAVAGGLHAYSLGIVGPQTYPVTFSIEFVAIVVIGGAGAIWGSVGTAAFFGIMPALQSGLGRFSAVTGAIGILLVLTRYPGGQNQIGRELANRFRARRRRREGAKAASNAGTARREGAA